MRIEVITLFPELLTASLQAGLVGKAIQGGRAEVRCLELFEFTDDKHRTVDEPPYGGGAGMVLKPEPLERAIAHAKARIGPARVVLLTPQGRPLRQADLVRWSKDPGLILVAGRYEGFDERVRGLVDEEISLGDFVLTGGEIAAMAIIDGVVRLLPGTVGNEDSIAHDSFSDGLLEHAQYTRPPEFRGQKVPEILLSGDHGKIAAFRRADALLRTRAARPELLARRGFDEEARAILESSPSLRPPVSVVLESKSGALALEPWARLVAAYGLERLWVVPSDGTDPAGFAVRLEAAKAGVQPPPPRALPRGLPRRRREALIEADRRASGVLLAAKERILARGSARAAVEELQRTEPQALVVRAALEPPPAEVRAPEEILEAGRAGLILVFSDDPELSAGAFLPVIRVSSPYRRLGPVLGPALLLDRLLGER
ncbi:MAG: tRNA (guanosine(37)-N1)-methyltransferase TrmD [Myxococcota bacterium]